MSEDRRCWTATLYPNNVETRRVAFGAIRRSLRLHWTREAAQAEADSWMPELLAWEILDEEMVMGRAAGYYAVVRSILLPLGDCPA